MQTQPNDLESRIRRARGEHAMGREPPSSQGLGMGIRVLVEFIAPLGVGGFIGWGIDGFFATRPWFLLLFLVLGFIGGILAVVRTGKR